MFQLRYYSFERRRKKFLKKNYAVSLDEIFPSRSCGESREEIRSRAYIARPTLLFIQSPRKTGKTEEDEEEGTTMRKDGKICKSLKFAYFFSSDFRNVS